MAGHSLTPSCSFSLPSLPYCQAQVLPHSPHLPLVSQPPFLTPRPPPFHPRASTSACTDSSTRSSSSSRKSEGSRRGRSRGGGEDWGSRSALSSSWALTSSPVCPERRLSPPHAQPQPQSRHQQQHQGSEWGSMEEVYEALALRLLSLALSTPAGSKRMVALAGPPGAGKSTVGEEVVGRVNDATWRAAALAGGILPFPVTPNRSSSSGSSSSGSTSGNANGSMEGRGNGGGNGAVGEDRCPAEALQQALQQHEEQQGEHLAVAVPMDGFHLYRWQLDCMPNPREAHARRGAPWTFDPAALYRHLKRILDKGYGFLPSFDHGVGDPVERDIFVSPQVRVVLVEGNYLLLGQGGWAPLRSLFSETWFLDVDVDEAMRRVEDRHVSTGNSRELARYRVRNNDRPNALLVLATRDTADVVVPSFTLHETS